MKLSETPFFQVLESMTEEEKKIYLPGFAMAAMIDYTMAANDTSNDDDRQEYEQIIDDLYIYANNNGVNTPELQEVVITYAPIAMEASNE